LCLEGLVRSSLLIYEVAKLHAYTPGCGLVLQATCWHLGVARIMGAQLLMG
jgi:hypothetical protein